jgi:membrane associated rhomboid family serine protease
MIPYRDEIGTVRKPSLTWFLIGINTIVFATLMLVRAGNWDWLMWGVVPSRYSEALDLRAVLSLFTAQFLHIGWIHLIGNMLYLAIFGDNLEDKFGRRRFVIFYLLTGLIAMLTQILSEPSSPVSVIGASGAVAGVMGGYLRLFPKAKVWVLKLFYFPYLIPASWALVYWFVIQLLDAGMLGGQPTVRFGRMWVDLWPAGSWPGASSNTRPITIWLVA